MNLDFMTHWGKEMGELVGKPTYFVEKIWTGIISDGILSSEHYSDAHYAHLNQFGKEFDSTDELMIYPKLHTIREDKNNRWKIGSKIHFTINGRTKNRFQFAPVIEVKNVQEIKTTWRATHIGLNYDEERRIITTVGFRKNLIDVEVDKKPIGYSQIEKLAINDGFNSIEDFFRFFNKDFSGKIIHWTDLKY